MNESYAYRNIRYAKAERFAAAELLPFEGIDPHRARGPVPPQNPSRFDILLGAPAPLEQTEDCQVLSVFTPSTDGRRPVMVWFHGGASITGGGELPWYDGTLLATEQDVVVVTVTARLGALGFLSLNDRGDRSGQNDRADYQGIRRDAEQGQPSPATTDHAAALEWVHRYIDQLGGDPDNITVFGQSAGGYALEVLLRWGLGTHIKGAIIQSGFLSQSSIQYHHAEVTHQAEDFIAFLGRNPQELSTEEILTAQAAYAQHLGKVEVWAPVRPAVETPITIPVIAGFTTHDTLPFLLLPHGITTPGPADLDLFGDVMRLENDASVLQGNYRLLDDAVAHGQGAWHYEFNTGVPQAGWGAPHCIELPFLLGDRYAWQDAPMLKGADWDVIDRQGGCLRSAWASFARHHTPGDSWTPYDPATRTATATQDLVSGPLPAGVP